MIMTGTTLNSTVLDKNPVKNAAADTRKAAGKTQDFGDVLGKTAQKLGQTDKTSADITKADTKPKNVEAATKPAEKSDGKTVKETTATEDAAADNAVTKDAAADNTADGTEETVVEETNTKETAEEPAAGETVVENKTETGKPAAEGTSGLKETAGTEEPVDAMTAEEIANALEYIIEQIKQILGITDEELLAGMEKLDMTKFDLLDSGNMAQLVTAISGEDSVISLVADENLYTALQDISEMVDTKADELLDKTGLTEGELDIVLEKLKELESKELGAEPGIIPDENQAAQENGENALAQPVFIKEDNTQPAKQYDTLPENQQDNPVETLGENKTQNTQKDTKGDEGKESKNFGHNGASQDFRSNISEVGDAAAAEGTAKFTSESTENILRQLADMVKIVKNENLTEMELQLHPASLGTVNVSLTTKGGVVTAQFTTQNEAVKTAIEAQVSQLQANLEEQGVKVEAVEVSVASHEMERNLDKDGRGEQQQAEQENAQRIQGARRRSINLRTFEEGGELEEEMSGADDATRIAMEIMAANGNSMDLLV